MSIATTTIQLYQILREKIGDMEAEALATFVDLRVRETNEQNLQTFATKEDLKVIELKISEAKTDIVKWVFAFFISLMLAVIGLYVRK